MLQSRTASGRVVPQVHDDPDSDSGKECANDVMTSFSIGNGTGSHEMKYRVPPASRMYDQPSLSCFSKSRLGSMSEATPPESTSEDNCNTTKNNSRSPYLKRKKASLIKNFNHRSSLQAFRTMILMPKENNINVLRTSIYELHERVKYRWVLHPLSNFKTIWDLLNAMVVIYYSWMVPFMLCFEWYTPSEATTTIFRLLDIWGLLDVLLRFRTGIIEYGTVVLNPRRIRQEYLRSIWFPIDLVSSIPFEYFIGNSANASTRKSIKIIKYIKLPRLLRIGRFVKYVKRYKRYSGMTISIHALLFIAHVSGCVWVAVLSPCSGIDGEMEPKCQPGEEMSLYWISFHHGLVTLLGISVNHIEASEVILDGGYHKTSLEDGVFLWSCIVSIIGAVVTAILFGTVVDIVQSWNRVENTFRKKMDQISHEMDALCLPKHIRNRVNAYYDYLWLNNRTFSEELNLLKDNGMSMALRQQIAIYLFKDYLQKIPFFQSATDSILGMICLQLHQVIYMPDDYIIKEGEVGKELFMIVKGIVRVMPPKEQQYQTERIQEKKKIEQQQEQEEKKKILLGEGDFFGEISVVMEVERTRSVKAECMAELCILSREGFDKILAEFPEFAIAMKKLIIKRVSALWKQDGKEKIEKMTALADEQMEKKINAYLSVKKLRNVVRLFNSNNNEHLPTQKEQEKEEISKMMINYAASGSSMKEQEVNDAAVIANTAAGAIAAQVEEEEEEKQQQQQQKQHGNDINKSTSKTMEEKQKKTKNIMKVTSLRHYQCHDDHYDQEEPHDHYQYDHEHEDEHERDHDRNEVNALKKIHELQIQMRSMECKVNDRFHTMEDKLNLILQALTSTNTTIPTTTNTAGRPSNDQNPHVSTREEEEEKKQEKKEKKDFTPPNTVEDVV